MKYGELSMSRTIVLAFVQKLDNDAGLHQKAIALQGDVDGLVRLAAQAGYTFTAQDWQEAQREPGELSEDDLNNVAGGAGSRASATGNVGLGPFSL